MFKNIVSFYDKYHKKNDIYRKIISDNNFTYFYIMQLLQKHCIFKAKSILDVGCGVGTLSNYLANRYKDKNIVGIDVSIRAIRIANNAKREVGLNNVKFFLEDIEEHVNHLKSRSHSKYDVLISTEVIEHVDDDGQFMRKLNSALKIGGCLILTTPTPENIMSKWKLYTNFDREVGHLRKYTKKELKSLIESYGFKVIYFRQTESFLRSILFIAKFDLLVKLIRGPLVPIFHYVDELVGSLVGFTDNQLIATKVKDV